MLEFPCDKCGKSFPYAQLDDHACSITNDADDDVEIVSVVTKKRSSLMSLMDTKRRKSLENKPKNSAFSRSSVFRSKSHDEHESGTSSSSQAGGFLNETENKYYDKLDHLLDEETILLKKMKHEENLPLSKVLEPKVWADYKGDPRLVGPKGIITKYIANRNVPSMIFWGMPGTGKTTLVRLLLKKIVEEIPDSQVYEQNAASSGLADLRKIYDKFKASKQFNANLRLYVFVDEIHRFSKLQQDFFLKLIETNELVFYGCTTENPSYKINDAMLSRCQIFYLEPPSIDDVFHVINSGILYINKARILLHKLQPIVLTKEAKMYLSSLSEGDYRVGLNILEMLVRSYDDSKRVVDLTVLKQFVQSTSLIKSVPGESRHLYRSLEACFFEGDRDTALVLLARLLKLEIDPLEVANFLQEFLINNIDESRNFHKPTLSETANNVYYVVSKLGLPECDLALAQLTTLLCDAPKSENITKTIDNITSFFEKNPTALTLEIPLHIRNAPTGLMKDLGYGNGYKYNPDFKDGVVNQRYLPRGIRRKTFVVEKSDGESVGGVSTFLKCDGGVPEAEKALQNQGT